MPKNQVHVAFRKKIDGQGGRVGIKDVLRHPFLSRVYLTAKKMGLEKTEFDSCPLSHRPGGLVMMLKEQLKESRFIGKTNLSISADMMEKAYWFHDDRFIEGTFAKIFGFANQNNAVALNIEVRELRGLIGETPFIELCVKFFGESGDYSFSDRMKKMLKQELIPSISSNGELVYGGGLLKAGTVSSFENTLVLNLNSLYLLVKAKPNLLVTVKASCPELIKQIAAEERSG